MSNVVGIPVLVHDPCPGCGSNACFIGTGPAPTFKQLLCDACEVSRGYASKELITFLENFIQEFGWPDRPIVLRSGELLEPDSTGDGAVTATETKTKTEPKPKGKLKMKAQELFPSKYLRAADLKGKSRKVKIADVSHDTFKDNGVDVVKAVLHLDDGTSMVCNKTNWGMLAAISGEDDDANWVGVEVELKAQKVSGPGGKIVDSIRVYDAA
jgi:hypothetical protein